MIKLLQLSKKGTARRREIPIDEGVKTKRWKNIAIRGLQIPLRILANKKERKKLIEF